MRTILLFGAIGFLIGGNAFADPVVQKTTPAAGKTEEKLVFVTGSHIPQRVRLRPIGSATVSPVRIIDRHEIDGTGRSTTPGAFRNEPAARIVGH